MDFDITFYNCKVTIIGSNDLVVNVEEGYTITIGSDLCGNVAEVVSDDEEGRLFVSVADYIEAQEVLSIKDIKTSIENIGKLPRDMQMEIYDIMGRVRLKGNTSDYTLDGLHDKYNGVYILKITDGNTVATIKQVF